MKTPKLVRTFLWIFGYLSVLAAFIVLDWYPTIKELGRLRRERSDLERKIKDYSIMASNFVFPDEEEEKHFRRSDADFCRELTQMENDATWLQRWSSQLRRQAERDKLSSALFLFSAEPDGKMASGVRLTAQEPDADWLAAQLPGIQKCLLAVSSKRFLWESLFFNSSIPFSAPLASRPLAIAFSAPLPALLNFINRCSWNMRLEIIHLYLEPNTEFFRAWLICRSSFLVRAPSAWAMKMESGNSGDDLLVDPDSPMLWQKVNSEIASEVSHRDLPPTVPKPK